MLRYRICICDVDGGNVQPDPPVDGLVAARAAYAVAVAQYGATRVATQREVATFDGPYWLDCLLP